ELRRLLLRLLESLQRDLQLAAAALQLLQLGAFARQHRDQVFELRLLQPRHRAQPLDILLSLDVEHKATKSHPIADGKFIPHHLARGQHFLSDERAALDEERQLARRQPHRRAAAIAPEIGKAAALQSLHEDAQPGPIPQQHLAPRALRVHEEVQLAAHRVGSQLVLDDADQAVVALPQIHRASVRPDPHRSRQRDHASRASNATTVSTSSPSTRWPLGATTVRFRGRTSSATSTATKPGDASHSRRTVSAGNPISRPILNQLLPSARSPRPTAVIWRRSSAANRRPRPPSRRASAARSLRISVSIELSSQGLESRARRSRRQDGLRRGVTNNFSAEWAG